MRFLACALLALIPVSAQVKLTLLSRFPTSGGMAAESEITAFDAKSKRLFVTNGAAKRIDILDASDMAALKKVGEIAIPSTVGEAPNSVAVHNGLVAIAVEANPKQEPGAIVFADTDGTILKSVRAGALPDMITFTPDGTKVLTANEGEPNASYSVDPPGTVTIVDISGGVANLTEANVSHVGFEEFTRESIDPRIRIYGPGASVAQDMEPEYITVSADSKTAFVTLQENNALALIDIQTKKVTRLVSFGFKDHNAPGAGLDASDRDNAIRVMNWPVLGMYQPDSIAAYSAGGRTYLVTANEGDARDYQGFAEESRVSALTLDPRAFPNGAMLKRAENLGRLTVTKTLGDDDGDGDYDRLFALGGRSFSIWSTDGTRVWDSGDQMERITAARNSKLFNSDGTEATFDTRSDNKGPEPEGLAVGRIGDQTFAFIASERTGGLFVYEITNPQRPEFLHYIPNADGDRSPEGVHFIPGAASPTGKPVLVLSNEVSGTTSAYELAITPEVTGKVRITNFGVIYNQLQRRFTAAINLRNIGAEAIAGPLNLVIEGLPEGVTLLNASGVKEVGPYVTVPTGSSLDGGASFTFVVEFVNPTGRDITFRPRLFTGSLN